VSAEARERHKTTERDEVGRKSGGGGGTALGVSLMDNLECKFNMNTFKIYYVENTSMLQYKHRALTRAKQVSAGG